MTTIGRDTDSPFRTRPDLDVAARHRPAVDDETMLRATHPVPAPPPDDTPRPRRTAEPRPEQPHRERSGRRPHPGGNRG
jgi:hypothetical protein